LTLVICSKHYVFQFPCRYGLEDLTKPSKLNSKYLFVLFCHLQKLESSTGGLSSLPGESLHYRLVS
jgi:hypothetical protein